MNVLLKKYGKNKAAGFVLAAFIYVTILLLKAVSIIDIMKLKGGKCMTFEQIKSKLKLHKTLVISGSIAAFFASTGILVGRFSILNVSMLRIVISCICYMVTITALASVGYGLHYITSHTKCLKCKKRIEMKEILKMETFRCPYCGNEKFDNDTVEIWFK